LGSDALAVLIIFGRRSLDGYSTDKDAAAVSTNLTALARMKKRRGVMRR
jgi:hypothetical protein